MGAWIMLATDAMFGDPSWLPHPVIGIGKIIAWWEKKLYGEDNRHARGFVFTILVLLTTSSLAFFAHLGLTKIPFGWILEAIICGWFLAAKSLAGVSNRMKVRFQSAGLPGARKLISEFVSRDTASLTEDAILRATVETMAENIIDGVLAPIFFFYIGQTFGSALMGIVFYKTINTLDSMVGYRNERYGEFGTAAARIDDLANWLPARLGACVILLSGKISHGKLRRGWKTMIRDRRLHSSPNSAYAEASIAGLYACRLGGPSEYFGELHDRPWIGAEFANPDWACLEQVKKNIWFSEILFVLVLEGGRFLWG